MNELMHPLRDVVPPTVRELVERSDEAARRLIEDACRMRAHRLTAANALQVAYATYAAAPIEALTAKLALRESDALLPVDVLRALLASHRELLRECFLSEPNKPSQAFAQQADHWRDVLWSTSETPRAEYVSARWGRRWALALLEQPNLRLDVDRWLGAAIGLMGHALPDWLFDFEEGLLTPEEALALCMRHHEFKYGEHAGPANRMLLPTVRDAHLVVLAPVSNNDGVTEMVGALPSLFDSSDVDLDPIEALNLVYPQMRAAPDDALDAGRLRGALWLADFGSGPRNKPFRTNGFLPEAGSFVDHIFGSKAAYLAWVARVGWVHSMCRPPDSVRERR